jgi:hypothetical protein
VDPPYRSSTDKTRLTDAQLKFAAEVLWLYLVLREEALNNIRLRFKLNILHIRCLNVHRYVTRMNKYKLCEYLSVYTYIYIYVTYYTFHQR